VSNSRQVGTEVHASAEVEQARSHMMLCAKVRSNQGLVISFSVYKSGDRRMFYVIFFTLIRL
jgi:hypothetical protein